MLNGGGRRFVLELVGGMPSVEKYVNRVQDLQTKLTFSTMYIQATIIWIEFVLKIKSAERETIKKKKKIQKEYQPLLFSLKFLKRR
jgi:hypothetical protein